MRFRSIAATVPIAAIMVFATACGSDTSPPEAADSSSSTHVVAGSTQSAAPSSAAVGDPADPESEPAPQQDGDRPAPSRSGPPTPPDAPEPDPDPQTDTYPQTFVGTWARHGSLLAINADNTGTIRISSAAGNGEQWSLTWRKASNAIEITVDSLISRTGDGIEGYLAAGQQLVARYTDGVGPKPVLTVSGFRDGSTVWCGYGGRSPECGA